VHDSSVTTLASSERSLILFPCISCLFFFNWSFLVFCICARHFSYFFLEWFHFTFMHVNSLLLYLNFSFLISMQDISPTCGLVSFHFHVYHVTYIFINCPFPLFHFWARHFSYSSLHPRTVSFDFHATHVFYSSFLIAHSCYFIAVHDNSVISLCIY
jgi:hypothetical protein